jgi:hypothetical protein
MQQKTVAQELGLIDPDGTRAVTPRMQDLIERVVDDYPKVCPFVYHCYCHRRSNEIWRYLIGSGLTGRKLHEWLTFHFGKSMLSPIKEILKRIDNEKNVQPIIAGRDYVSK